VVAVAGNEDCNWPLVSRLGLRSGPAMLAPCDGDHTEQITSAMFTPISEIMQHLELSDEEAAALINELADITGNDGRYR
jgi:hypothetical protein